MSDMTKSMILIFSDARATFASAPNSPWARNCNLSLQEFWEKKPLHMKRDDPEYYKTLFSTKALDKVILEEMSSKIIRLFFLPDSSGAEGGFWKELGCDLLL